MNPHLTSLGNYSFFAPAQVVFGWGRRHELGKLLAGKYRRALLVSGSRTLERAGIIAALRDSVAQFGIATECFTAAAHEPEVADVDALTAQFRALNLEVTDCVIAVGGGSAIDLAKAAAALATNRQGDSVVDFLEGVGRGLQITAAPLPLIALPTTAGTGAEATKNAVVSSYAPRFKKSLRADAMIPRIALIDPELTVTAPPDVTAYTGMDAITQLIESYISKRHAPIPRALSADGLRLALPALETAVKEGTHRPAREAMAQAAFLSGMALANSGLGLAHGVAAALGVHAKVPHGLACAVMLVPALRWNRPVVELALADLAKHALPGPFSSSSQAAETLIATIESLCAAVNIPTRLRDLGVDEHDLPDLVPSSHGNSLSGNPRDITDAELLDLLKELW